MKGRAVCTNCLTPDDYDQVAAGRIAFTVAKRGARCSRCTSRTTGRLVKWPKPAAAAEVSK